MFKSKGDPPTYDRPALVPERDVTPRHIRKGVMGDSLLSQQECQAVQGYAHIYSPRNVKLDRKEDTLGSFGLVGSLGNSVMFDETGKPFVMYRGKSLEESVSRLVEAHMDAHTEMSPQEQRRCEALAMNPDYQEKKLLGQGAFGRVKIAQKLGKSATDEEVGKWVAVKIIETLKDGQPRSSELAGYICREKEILQRFGRLEGYAETLDPRGKRYIFQELIRGKSLLAWLGSVTLERRLYYPKIIANILEALEDFHGKKAIHRDLKLENIMIDPATHVIHFVDFGLSKGADHHLMTKEPKKIGTHHYLAPEVRLQEEGPYCYNEATDIYALGWVCGVLVFGGRFLQPFSECSDEELTRCGFERRNDFLTRGAPPSITEHSPADEQERFSQGEDAHDPENYPFAKLCLQAFRQDYIQQRLGSDQGIEDLYPQLARLKPEKRKWALIVGSMLDEAMRRPKLVQLQQSVQALQNSFRQATVTSSFGFTTEPSRRSAAPSPAPVPTGIAEASHPPKPPKPHRKLS